MKKAIFKTISALHDNVYYQDIKIQTIQDKKNIISKEEYKNLSPADKRATRREVELIENQITIEMDKQIEAYVKNEIDALHSIYLHRCLTLNQIYKMHFLKLFDSAQKFEAIIVNNWIKLGIVNKIYFKHNNYGIFLTTRGVDILVNEFDFPPNIIDENKRVVKRGYLRASELEMHPRLINHQVHLNQFLIDFKRSSIQMDKQFKTDFFKKIEYFDEKHMSKYRSIRPDGLLSLMNIDFFLEMDMATESKKQLIDKWNRYRNFLVSKESSFIGSKNKIIVLFILENSKDISQRKTIVKDSIAQTILDRLNSEEFEIYIGSSKEILNIVFNNILPAFENKSSSQNNLLNIFAKDNYMVSYGKTVKHYFENVEHDYYIRMINEDGSIKIVDNKAQEFLIDDYRDNPMSVLNKISYFKKNSLIFKASFKREIPLLIISNRHKEIFEDLSLLVFDFDRNDNIYFINIDINERNLSGIYKYIYQLDNAGNIYMFKNVSLTDKYFVKNILMSEEN